MTAWGWLFFAISNLSVVMLTGYCFWKVLSEPAPQAHMHAPLDVDTHDLNDGD